MESINFPEVNAAIAKDQPQYQTLFANIDPTKPGVPTTVCLKLSPEELSEAIMNDGEIWLTQMTNGNPYTPIRMSTIKPEMVKHDLTKYRK